MVTTNATPCCTPGTSSTQASSVITITGLGDHDRPDWLITMTGIRSGSAAAAIRTGAYDQIARSQADQARQAGAAAAGRHGAAYRSTARASISPRASATPSCAPPSRPTARCGRSA